MDEFYYDSETIEKTEALEIDDTKNVETENTKSVQIPKQSSVYTWIAAKPKKPIYIDSDTDDEEVKTPDKVEEVPKVPELPLDTSDVRIISGVNVEFPVKPYAPQIAIMDKVIKGIQKGQNCLLESPTGSGKTLALLCSALAWQKQEKDRIAKLRMELFAKQQEEARWRHPIINEKPPNTSPVKFEKQKTVDLDHEDEDVFKTLPPLSKRREFQSPLKNDPVADADGDSNLVNIHKRQRMSTSASPHKNDDLPAAGCCSNVFNKENIPEQPVMISKVPRIFFGTRTHKQIGQVIREFKKTAYSKNIKMTILSSREHTCVRNLESNFSSKTEMCREILDKKKKFEHMGEEYKNIGGCSFKDNMVKLLGGRAPQNVWDIEELVVLGKMRGACPYFAARELANNADIIFCPYNYLMDPLIRSSTSIVCDNDIILIDEAHNIEDVCRDSASLTLELEAIHETIKDIDHLLTLTYNVNHEINELHFFRKHLNNWSDWFENHTPLMSKQFNGESSYVMNGQEFAESMAKHSFDFDNFSEFLLKVTEMLERIRERRDEEKSKKISIKSSSALLLESMCLIFSFFYRNDCQNFDDYKSILIQKEDWNSKLKNSQGWKTKTSKKKSLHVMCMNPAVVYNPIDKIARCIILTSGTLTPTLSFPAELGSEFPINLQTGHVISPNQVWVGSVKSSPEGFPMEATFRNTSQIKWQDSLGKIILWICENVPHGVLCFLPSYRLMEILRERWQSTGMWDELMSKKSIFSESKKMKEHDEIMSDFYSCVGDENGALLFAVFRGKISEGMDFKDHQARAVISVGIPYPNVKDSMIDCKMKYNDSHRSDRGLLCGRDWLQVQAYRALNQALGRCIRHRNDWGAVIMIDSRFEMPSYTKHISKWVRNFLGENHHTWQSLTSGPNNLKQFIDKMSNVNPNTN